MSVPNRQASGGRGSSLGLRFRQPFKSPLRVSDAENVGTTSSEKVKKSPSVFSPVSDKQTNEMSQENASLSTTPKRSSISSSSRGASSSRRKLGSQSFSSPFRSPVSNVNSPKQTISKEEELKMLLTREEELDKEISSLKDLGCKVEELQDHIDNLHEYNEIKDSAQLVMGKLAELEGVTIKEMHERYEVTILE